MGRNTALIEYVAYSKYYSRTIILKHKDNKRACIEYPVYIRSYSRKYHSPIEEENKTELST